MKHLLWPCVIAVILFLAGPVRATPPDSIVVSLDSTQLLSVEVFHPVKQVSAHYIIRISVTLNGKAAVNQTFASQSSPESQYAYYRMIDAKPGDKIGVTAECNMYGKLTMTYVAPPL